MLGLDQFDASLYRLVEEGRSYAAIFLNFGMPIVGIAGTDANAFEKLTVRLYIRPQVKPILLDVEAGGFLTLPDRCRITHRYTEKTVISAV